MIVLTDDEGVVENSFVVSKDVLFVISLMDGTRSLRDIQAEYMRAHGQLIYLERLEEIVTAMDSNFLLLNDNYKSRLASLKMEYENSPVRKSSLAGKSYPGNRMDLLMQLDEMFKTARQVTPNGEIRAILAPHIDYVRGIEVYRETYGYMKHVEKPLLVIFGTCHRPTEKILSISLKDFETPLDVVPTSRDLSTLIRANGVLRGYIEEWPHRNEHSIELQLPLIQFNMQEDFEILPILTGSMHEYIEGKKDIDDDLLSELVENLKTVLARYGKPYIIIAGADLAHIGAQFGDPLPLDAMTLAESKAKDEEILDYIRKANARAFFDTIKNEKDARRICGLAPIYFQLRFLEGCAAEIVGYKQWTDGQSSVSFAGAVFHA
jgi:AmmeMemoRadiSam system protein B